ncbi:hypothetical protein EDD99_8157 [Streptomyces sp. 846.5]|nr:hypothetical protein [Streptomyces sp. 846.5]TDT93347.1 hypothetical protein EDD99_8157 [Streptomyces sp. 846.5]
MTLDLQHQAARRMRRLVLVLVAVVIVLVCAVVSLMARGSGHSSASQLPGPVLSPTVVPTSTASAAAPTSTASGTFVPPAQYVALPQASHTVDGLPMGWPHTPQGAIAMVVQHVTSNWTADPVADSKAARAYAPPGQADQQAADAAAGAQALRKAFGLPATGPLPAGASFTAWPIGVQWKALDADTVQMSVLVRESSSPGTGQPAVTRVAVTTAMANWTTAGDWKVIESPPTALPTPYDLGTSGFNDAGWIALQQGDH